MNEQRLAPITALQSEIEDWAARYWGGEYWPPLANLARLTEEVGEIARAVNQTHGPKRVKTDEAAAQLAGELGDALFVLLCLANSTNVDLQTAFDATLVKYRVRDEGDEA
ncbi:MAG TPA: nucleotide pyrophosphohydrolase [Thermomicrobiales bacterium]|nr:nucleotide pyrophosphohydrolase [Thermomicrobiales bacterium]